MSNRQVFERYPATDDGQKVGPGQVEGTIYVDGVPHRRIHLDPGEKASQYRPGQTCHVCKHIFRPGELLFEVPSESGAIHRKCADPGPPAAAAAIPETAVAAAKGE